MTSSYTTIDKDTIAAQATAIGRGGVGIVRISGPDVQKVAAEVLQTNIQPRYAHYGAFFDKDGEAIDEGISLYFPAPNSFTGEDVLELQGHGGPVVMDLLLKRILSLGVRQANPGEFSERAFLNDKMDLIQAEAIADLIDSTSVQAAQSAIRSLQGVFSKRVSLLIEELIKLRIYIEASIDFPEEEVDFLSDGSVSKDLSALVDNVDTVLKIAGQGVILKEGMTVVIAGHPNVGKSSLLNALSERDSAIVTDIAGTTRDVLREHIHIDGMPLHIIDTAGIREAKDKVEQIGVERALLEIDKADRVLLMVDQGTTSIASTLHDIWPNSIKKQLSCSKLTVIRNKIDITGEKKGETEENGFPVFKLSAMNSDGLEELKEHLKKCMGFESSAEGGFSARRRHLDALRRAREVLISAQKQLEHTAGELVAEELRSAQKSLGEITGDFSSDDLLGRIFSSFCIGK